MIIISPSLLASDFSRLGEELKTLEASGADWVHIDVMDGHFVNNITLGAPVIKSMRPHSGLVFDVHLMIDEPMRYIDDFIGAGADIITFHIESCSQADKVIEKIVNGGALPSISIKPGTPVETVFPFLEKLYMVLVMTVEPGFGGQPFIEETLPKLLALRREANSKAPEINIQVDGGINSDKIALAAKHGANAFAVGSAFFSAEDKKMALESLKRIAADHFDNIG